MTVFIHFKSFFTDFEMNGIIFENSVSEGGRCFMAIIQLVLSAVICGFLYVRMIRREVPEQIGKAQAIAPVGLGVASLFLSFLFFLGFAYAFMKLGVKPKEMAPLQGSVLGAFLLAGLPEELAKLLMILLALRVFRSKIRNVYEVILVGAGVGLGFTLFEEYAYGGDGANFLRLFVLAAHMVFGILMAKHLALARYDKMMHQGSPAREILLAIVIPMLIHTLYDATNASNKFLDSGDEDQEFIGILIGIIGVIIMFVFQILVLVRLKKNTEKYCAMRLLLQDSETSGAV